jgi:hypothetical protein
MRYYTQDEEDDLRSMEQPQDWHNRMNFTMTRLWPLPGKKPPSEEELNEMKKESVELTQEKVGRTWRRTRQVRTRRVRMRIPLTGSRTSGGT